MARLFHSLVVCGAGLTLVHCGGRSASHSGEGGADEASGSSTGSNAGKGAGGSSAQAGASAGALSLGGDVSAPSGGSSAGEPPKPTRPAGPTEQWGCDASGISCSGQRFHINHRACALDSTRPRGPAGCPAETVFTCLEGYLDGEPVLFNCACSAPTAGTCVCPEVLDNCSARVQPPDSCGATSECGCAITCILK